MRLMVWLISLPESSIAPYLTSLHQRLKADQIRVGSYPLLQRGVTVSLIGQDETKIRQIGDEVLSPFHALSSV